MRPVDLLKADGMTTITKLMIIIIMIRTTINVS